MSNQSRKSIWKRNFGCGGCLVVVLLGFVGLILISALGGNRGRPAPSPAIPTPLTPPAIPAPSVAAPDPSIAIGEQGTLERPGVMGVWMAVSIDDYHALTFAEFKINSEETEAEGRLFRAKLGLANRIKIVRNGTRVRVMDAQSGGLQVEALDGDDEGRSGWVHSWCVKPVPKPTPEQEQAERARLAEQEREERTRLEDQEQAERDRFEEEGRIVAEKRAAGLIRIGQNLEKSGKTKGALDTYRRIVKEFPDTPQAKAAAARIAAPGGE
jgi:hypothetical protein